MNIYQDKIDNKHQESFWYDGEIASKGKYTLVATGSIRVAVDDGSDYMNDYEALEYADYHKWTDEDLEKFNWDMNNWFEIINNDGTSAYDDVAYTYDEGIELLKNYEGK